MILAFLGCGAFDAAPATAPDPLDDEAYRFCHVDGANAQAARVWCAVLDDDAKARCPGLVATCSGIVSKDPVGCEPERVAEETDDLGGTPEPPPTEWWPELSCGGAAGSGASLFRWFTALAVAALMLVVARLVWSVLGSFRPAQAPPRVDTTAAPAPIAEDTTIPEGPSDDLLSAARAALAAGRAKEAVLYARGAALRRLGEAGKILLHRSRTDREYARRLSGEPVLQMHLRDIVRTAEVARYGSRPTGLDGAAAAIQAAEKILSALVTAALVGVLALASPDARAQDYAAFDPAGDAALLPLLRNWGYDPGWRLRSLADLDDTTDAMILDLTRITPTPENWDAVERWVEAGGVLVVAGDASLRWPELGRFTFTDADPFAVLARGPERSEGGSEDALPAVPDAWKPPTGGAVPPDSPPGPPYDPAAVGLHPDFESAGVPVPRFAFRPSAYVDGVGRGLVTFDVAFDLGSTAPEDEVPADGTLGMVVEALDQGDGVVVAVAEASLLRNASFACEDNQRFVGELLYVGQALQGWPMSVPAKVQLATSAAARADEQSGASQSPLASLAQSGLLVFVAQLVLTWTTAAFRKGWPFVPLRDPPDEGRTHFVDHVVALGTRHYQRSDAAWALHRAAALWVGRLGRSGLELAAQRAGYTPAGARDWAEGIEALAAAAPEPSGGKKAAQRAVDSDLQQMEELWRVTRKEHR